MLKSRSKYMCASLSSPKSLLSLLRTLPVTWHLSFSSVLSHVPVFINSDKSCLIFHEAQLEPKVWQGSQGPSWEKRSSPPFLRNTALFLTLGLPTQHPTLTSGVHKAILALWACLNLHCLCLLVSWCPPSRNPPLPPTPTHTQTHTFCRGWRAA